MDSTVMILFICAVPLVAGAETIYGIMFRSKPMAKAVDEDREIIEELPVIDVDAFQARSSTLGFFGKGCNIYSKQPMVFDNQLPGDHHAVDSSCIFRMNKLVHRVIERKPVYM